MSTANKVADESALLKKETEMAKINQPAEKTPAEKKVEAKAIAKATKKVDEKAAKEQTKLLLKIVWE